MSRKSFYLKPTGRGTCPGLIVSVFVSDRTVGGEECDPRCRVRVFHSVTVAWSHHCKGRWTAPRVIRFGDTESFWRWLDGLGKCGRRTYVFSPIASDALTLLGFWRLVRNGQQQPGDGDTNSCKADGVPSRSGEYRIDRLVLSGRPDVVGYTVSGVSHVWLSGRQFWDYTAADLYERLTDDGRDQEEHPTRCGPFDGRAESAARLWLWAMTLFADWWCSLGAGPFPRTVPGGAMQFFRSRMPKRSIVVHKDEEPYRLERSACHGGRASCWFYGTVVAQRKRDRVLGIRPDQASIATMAGPVHRVDVRSMYPALLRDREYPVSIVKYSEQWEVSDVLALTRRYGVIADVQLDAGVPEYPCRVGERVDYPVGVFRSVLCGNELKLALESNIVRRIYRAANYEMGRPFNAAASELCEMRQRCRDRGRIAWELLAKTLGNSLAGKLAQNPRGWQEVPSASHYPPWDVWFDRDSDTGTTRRFRCIAGRVYEFADIGVGSGCLTACFAFLTSYGRALMRSYRETCPPFSVLSQDTDGLWLTGAGLDALHAACALPPAPATGQLAKVECSSEGYWLGPKHYRTDRGWTLAGYHTPRPPRGMLVTDSYDVNPVRAGCVEPPVSLQHWTRYGKLPKPPPAGWVDPAGWAAPVRLPQMPGDVGPYHLPPPDDPAD